MKAVLGSSLAVLLILPLVACMTPIVLPPKGPRRHVGVTRAFDCTAREAYFRRAMTRYWYWPFISSGAAPFASGSEGVE
jgi:hypothetical protein